MSQTDQESPQESSSLDLEVLCNGVSEKLIKHRQIL